MKIYRCPHCDKLLKRSSYPQYDLECLDCDENFYESEAIPDEILVPHCAVNPSQSNNPTEKQ